MGLLCLANLCGSFGDVFRPTHFGSVGDVFRPTHFVRRLRGEALPRLGFGFMVPLRVETPIAREKLQVDDSLLFWLREELALNRTVNGGKGFLSRG